MNVHAIAEGANIGVMDLRRLIEFGSVLEAEQSNRLVSLYARTTGTTTYLQRYSAPQRRLRKSIAVNVASAS